MAEIPYKIALGNNVFQLPGGLRVPGKSGVVLRRVTMRPTNGFDEEAVLTSELAVSTSAITTTLLSRTITDIEGISDPKKIAELVPDMLLGDRLALLLMLDKISAGDEKPVEFSCPRGHTNKDVVDIDKIAYTAPAELKDVYVVPIPVGYEIDGRRFTSVDLRLLTGRHEQELERFQESIGLQKSKILSMSCVRFTGHEAEMNPLWVSGMSARDRNHIIDAMDKLTPGPHMVVSKECQICRTATKIRIRADRFFGG